MVKSYDFITFKKSLKKKLLLNLLINFEKKSNFLYLTLPPLHIECNYKTMTFLLVRKLIDYNKLSYPFEMNLNKLTMSYKSFN